MVERAAPEGRPTPGGASELARRGWGPGAQPPGDVCDGGPVLERVLQLARWLRRDGIEVSTGELIDAVEALRHLDLGDRAVVQAGLRATLVKDAGAAERFDRLFDLLFGVNLRSRLGPDGEAPAEPGRAPRARRCGRGRGGPGANASGLSEAVFAALRAADREQLMLLAAQAVELHAGLAGAEGSERYFLHRVLRALDLSAMLSAALQQLRRRRRPERAGAGPAAPRAERAARGVPPPAGGRAGRPPPPARAAARPPPTELVDRELGSLSPSELAELRRVVQPLARRLAVRIGRRRRTAGRGRLDMRRTLRRSMQAGGVPVDVVLRRRRPHRPEIVLLCDVSGSVAQYARFTFSLVHALHDELRHVRSFAFVDGVAEVTDLFDRAAYDIPVGRLVERAGVVGVDGHSDYGAVFRRFEAEHGRDVTARTTVVVLGDARSNYRDPGEAAFRSLARRARRVYWLHPEPTASWDEADAVMATYLPHCHGAYEVRSLRQLGDVIARLRLSWSDAGVVQVGSGFISQWSGERHSALAMRERIELISVGKPGVQLHEQLLDLEQLGLPLGCGRSTCTPGSRLSEKSSRPFQLRSS